MLSTARGWFQEIAHFTLVLEGGGRATAPSDLFCRLLSLVFNKKGGERFNNGWTLIRV